MHSTIKYLFVVLLIILFASECRKDPDVIPNVYVNITININEPEYIDLNTVGGWVYLTGGLNGIYVRRSDINEFMAFDRTCSYKPEENNRVQVVDSVDYYLGDPVCGSKFLVLDGSPDGNGPATHYLKRYQTEFDEGTGILRIYNR